MGKTKSLGMMCVLSTFLIVAVVQAGAGDLAAEKIFPSLEAAVLGSGLDLSKIILMSPLGYHEGVALYQIEANLEQKAIYAFVTMESESLAVPSVFVRGRAVPIVPEIPAEPKTTGEEKALWGGWCAPEGGFDDTLSTTRCCSGVAVSGSTVCVDEEDWGTTWDSCSHLCGTRLVGGCVPSGGVDDTLGSTSCCSGQAVSGSTRCLNPADYGTTWRTCIHTCL